MTFEDVQDSVNQWLWDKEEQTYFWILNTDRESTTIDVKGLGGVETRLFFSPGRFLSTRKKYRKRRYFMTKKELSQLYYLKKEIKEQQRRIAELEAAATKCTANISGMPSGKGISDKVGQYAAQIADLKAILDLNLKKSFYELNKLTRYIESIEDSEMKLIFSFRYIQNMSWYEISKNLGSLGDGSTERKKHNRFLKVSRNS